MARAHWGKAKHEVLILKDDILKQLNKGKTLEEIYHDLIADGKISVGSRTFRRHAASIRDGLCSGSDTRPGPPANGTRAVFPASVSASAPASVPQSTPASISSQPVSFGHEAAADEDTIRAFFEGDG